jgi:hypothetical protein
MLRVLLLVLFLSPQLVAQEEWKVHQLENSVFVEKHGEVTWGDKLRFRMAKDSCDVVEHLFTFYTVSNHQDITQLKGKVVPINNNDIVVGTEILFVKPFLLGHSVWFTIGRYWVDEHIKFLQELNSFRVTLIDDDDFIVQDYFDIPNNEWVLNDVGKAMKDGQEMCRAL